MPQMGVSVAEGTVVEWKKQPGDWVERDEIIASISTDKIDTDVEAPASGRVQEVLVEVGATVDVGVVLARIATDAKPGEAHASESESSSEGTSEAEVALEAPGEAGELSGRHDRGARRDRPARLPRGAPLRPAPLLARGDADRRRARHRPRAGRGHRPRRPRAQARRARLPRVGGNGGAAVEEPPMHIESPYKPDAPAAPRKPKSARPRRAAPTGEGQPLSRMRQSIGRAMVDSLQTAATCTTIIEADMTGIAADREKTGLTWLPYVARATIEALGDFPSLNATLEGETFTRARRRSTSASPCRSARAG